jgi:hypothetical protein
MIFDRGRCLHCDIIEEIGRRLEGGTFSGQQALDDLILVLADILATTPADQAQELMAGIVQALPSAEAHARERMKQEPSLQRRHG